MIKLSEKSRKLLEKCLRESNPELISIVNDPSVSNYSPDFYNRLRDYVGDEFIRNGLKSDFEPNEYGLRLESLIDEIGNLFF